MGWMHSFSSFSSQMYKKDLYNMEDPVRINHSLKQSMSYSHQPPYQDKQPYREYDHPPYGYDGGGYTEPKPHNTDSHLHYDNRVPHYNEQWPPYDQQTSSSQPAGYQPGHQQPMGYNPRSPYEDGPGRDYSPPQPRYDEAPPVGYDGRPRHSKPGPIRYDEPPPPPLPPAGYDARSPYEAETHSFPINSPRSPEPSKQYYGDSGLRSSYMPGPPNRGFKPGMHDAMRNSEPTIPPPKPEALPSPGDPAITPGSKPPPPPPQEDLDEDPAMKPQSVLNRVKMFENKRSVSMDRAKEGGDSSVLRPADIPKPVIAPGPVLKANSLSNLEQEKSSYRAPEPQKPHTKPLDDVVRSNHYDPDEDEEYYRKQLSYFDRRSFDSKAMGQPTPGINRFHDLPKPPQLSYPYNRVESVEKVSPVEKRYDPLPQISPSSQYGPPASAIPPATLPKLSPGDGKLPKLSAGLQTFVCMLLHE